MNFRTAQATDYNIIHSKINEWWGGRNLSDMLPKLFFIHFSENSFVIEENKKIIGFLVGFISQSYPDEAYIHFVGIDPEYRDRGLGRKLYTLFMETIRAKGCSTIRCVTSPVNKTSIKFHQRMGFEIESGDEVIDGVPVTKDYDGIGGARVLFKKTFNDYVGEKECLNIKS